MRILIFRHGETDYNLEGRFQGHLDVPLNATGREQARTLITTVREFDAESILSSDLSRAYESARIVANALGLPVFARSGLREAYLGLAQGLTLEDIRQKFGHETLTRWRSNTPTDADFTYPEGESANSIIERVFLDLEGFLDLRLYERVAVASHGGVIRRIMQRVLPAGSSMVPIPNGVTYRLSFDPDTREWRVCDR